MTNDNLYQSIIDYIIQGPNHERKKIEIIKKFNISRTTFQSYIIQMTCKDMLYENTTGRKVGILIKEEVKHK